LHGAPILTLSNRPPAPILGHDGAADLYNPSFDEPRETDYVLR
jgi:hypothetical protein